ncbi:MAG: Bax inhibitor-1 family protein [Gemmataceae bacterium]|nr:Bax inhibitor-1 family protein [Gemmataceae bacterium]
MARYEYELEGYGYDAPIAMEAERSERAIFIQRTYAHLAGAVLAFTALLTAFFTLLPQEDLTRFMMTVFGSPLSLLILLAAFIGCGYLARYWAHASTSLAMQYLGLALYVLFEALIFVPILYVARYRIGDPNLIAQAGIMTLCVFGGLTVSVFVTRKDFSFLGPILSIAGFLLMGLIIAAIFFPIGLGLGFSFVMVVLASAFILYDTSNVLHHYRTDQYVGAALELFASLALLFYYILRIFIQSRD